MTDFSFDSSTSRFDLPLLFAAQAQKEIFVNEMASRIDCLLHPVIEGVANLPPQTSTDGQAWIIGPDAAGLWAGRSGKVAVRRADDWLYINPVVAMRAFDKSSGRDLVYRDSWMSSQRPAIPNAGTTVDIEARAAIQEIIVALSTYGIFSAG